MKGELTGGFHYASAGVYWLLIESDMMPLIGMVISGCGGEGGGGGGDFEVCLRHTSQNEEILDADDLPCIFHFSAARPTQLSS